MTPTWTGSVGRSSSCPRRAGPDPLGWPADHVGGHPTRQGMKGAGGVHLDGFGQFGAWPTRRDVPPWPLATALTVLGVGVRRRGGGRGTYRT